MLTSYSFERIKKSNARRMEPVSLFLQKMGLGVDADVELFVIAYYN
ncbi:[citrate (pro-3S)-lyase] ligase, partial [Vibrio anguillarum]|nr:[citrate (pro-3S)-lyase] ligase [Vibrio anguillarum]